MWAPNGIHPDQHALVINPGNPTQIIQGSDGGVIRTTGTFSDISSHCNPGERPLLGAGQPERTASGCCHGFRSSSTTSTST